MLAGAVAHHLSLRMLLPAVARPPRLLPCSLHMLLLLPLLHAAIKHG